MRRFFKKIIHICEYLPVLWKDEHWDYTHIYTLLLFKLIKVRKAIIDDGHAIVPRSHLRRLDTAIGCLKRLSQDDYNSHYKQLREKWGDLEMVSVPSERGLYRVKFMYEDWDPKKRAAYNKELKQVYKHEEYLETQDINTVFNIIKKDIKHWWD